MQDKGASPVKGGSAEQVKGSKKAGKKVDPLTVPDAKNASLQQGLSLLNETELQSLKQYGVEREDKKQWSKIPTQAELKLMVWSAYSEIEAEKVSIKTKDKGEKKKGGKEHHKKKEKEIKKSESSK